jgi:hypothetical protein
LSLLGLAWLPFLLIYYRHSGGLRRRAAGTHAAEPPSDLPPALVGLLFTGTVTSLHFTATILDLVRRRVVRMERLRTSPPPAAGPRATHAYRFTIDRTRLAGLRRLEEQALYTLFNCAARGADTITVEDARVWWIANGDESSATWRRWTEIVVWEAGAARLVGAHWRRPRTEGIVISAAVLLVALVLRGTFSPAVNVSLAASALLMFALSRRLNRLTWRGVQLRLRYESFRNYLRDYGHFGDKPADAVIVWDEYLCLAVALGLAPRVVVQIAVPPPILETIHLPSYRQALRSKVLSVPLAGLPADVAAEVAAAAAELSPSPVPEWSSQATAGAAVAPGEWQAVAVAGDEDVPGAPGMTLVQAPPGSSLDDSGAVDLGFPSDYYDRVRRRQRLLVWIGGPIAFIVLMELLVFAAGGEFHTRTQAGNGDGCRIEISPTKGR